MAEREQIENGHFSLGGDEMMMPTRIIRMCFNDEKKNATRLF